MEALASRRTGGGASSGESVLKLATSLRVLAALLSLAGSSIAFAQSGRTSVFHDSIARIGTSLTLCHVPPGNPTNAHTIEVSPAAVPAHLAHGDLLGECLYSCNGPPAPVPKTGQTFSYWAGDDGAYQAGVSVDPRFKDNGDGTVTDNLTGLIWLQDANCFGTLNWTGAISAANTLSDGSCGLSDGSVAGDWRMPNVRELQSLSDYGQVMPALPPGHPFSGVVVSAGLAYWSSTFNIYPPGGTWGVGFNYGWAAFLYSPGALWPVRGGL